METTNQSVRILAVDDDRIILMMLQTQLEDLGYHVTAVSDGVQAWNILQQDKQAFDIIILDREMPRMNGIELVRLIKNDDQLNWIPIIMQTGSDKPEQIREGLDAGVFYYLSKPVNVQILTSVLSAAADEIQQRKTLESELVQHRNAFKLIDQCRFFVRTLDDVQDLSCFISNCFPHPARAVVGVAALLTNAVEHGNLEIGYQLKTQLINDGNWKNEVIHRLQLQQNQDKCVEVIVKRRKTAVSVQVIDQGPGFAWNKYLKLDPSRAQDNHGRGIAMANGFCFDEISYNEQGNAVTALCRLNEELQW